MAKVVDLRGRAMGGQDKRSRITKVARHHSATANGDVFAFENHWRNQGWRTGGYHEVILRDGTVQLCYDHNVVSNGVYGHNQTVYNICLVGNGSFTEAQEQAFDSRAKAAIKRFGLTANDVLGHQEFSGQNTACPGTNMSKVRARLKGKGDKIHEPNPKVKASKPAPKQSPLLKLGSKGKAVEDLQNKLISKGYSLPVYGADGHFGGETLQAVTAFQRDNSLSVDGIVGKETNAALNAKASSKQFVPYPNKLFRSGSRGNDVKRIQRAINNAAGRNILAVDGIFGAQTDREVRNYQRRHKLVVDGIVGAQTWSVMFGGVK